MKLGFRKYGEIKYFREIFTGQIPLIPDIYLITSFISLDNLNIYIKEYIKSIFIPFLLFFP